MVFTFDELVYFYGIIASPAKDRPLVDEKRKNLKTAFQAFLKNPTDINIRTSLLAALPQIIADNDSKAIPEALGVSSLKKDEVGDMIIKVVEGIRKNPDSVLTVIQENSGNDDSTMNYYEHLNEVMCKEYPGFAQGYILTDTDKSMMLQKQKYLTYAIPTITGSSSSATNSSFDFFRVKHSQNKSSEPGYTFTLSGCGFL